MKCSIADGFNSVLDNKSDPQTPMIVVLIMLFFYYRVAYGSAINFNSP